MENVIVLSSLSFCPLFPAVLWAIKVIIAGKGDV
jgi:hypothetical protein